MTPEQIQAAQAAFDAKFPLPANCSRFVGGYCATEFNAWDAHTHVERWEGWKAAWASFQPFQPRLKVVMTSYPESNGKTNWTALLKREDASWDGLVGNAHGITLARGELWNRVAYEAERTKFLLGLRDTEPFILDYGNDVRTPQEWAGEEGSAAHIEKIKSSNLPD